MKLVSSLQWTQSRFRIGHELWSPLLLQRNVDIKGQQLMSILDLPHISHIVVQSHQRDKLALKRALSLYPRHQVLGVVDLTRRFQNRLHFLFSELLRLLHFLALTTTHFSY